MSCISVVVVKIPLPVAYVAYCFDKMKLKRVSSFKSRTPYIHKKFNVASWRCFNRSRVSNTSRGGGGSRAFVLIEARGLVLEVLRYMLVFFVSCCLGFLCCEFCDLVVVTFVLLVPAK